MSLFPSSPLGTRGPITSVNPAVSELLKQLRRAQSIGSNTRRLAPVNQARSVSPQPFAAPQPVPNTAPGVAQRSAPIVTQRPAPPRSSSSTSLQNSGAIVTRNNQGEGVNVAPLNIRPTAPGGSRGRNIVDAVIERTRQVKNAGFFDSERGKKLVADQNKFLADNPDKRASILGPGSILTNADALASSGIQFTTRTPTGISVVSGRDLKIAGNQGGRIDPKNVRGIAQIPQSQNPSLDANRKARARAISDFRKFWANQVKFAKAKGIKLDPKGLQRGLARINQSTFTNGQKTTPID